jgi:molecular chaperone GrpE
VPDDAKRTTGEPTGPPDPQEAGTRQEDGSRDGLNDGTGPAASGDAGGDQVQADAASEDRDGSTPAPEGDGDPLAEPRLDPDEGVADDAAAADGDRDAPTILEVEGELLEEKPRPDLAEELAEARAESIRYLDDLRRLKAEFENFRKRMLRDQSAVIASASSALVARLLPVLDNFDLAISAAEQSQDFEKMLKGVEMVYGELRDVLGGEGLTEIEAEGKPFDPQRHEAVVAVEQEGVEPGTVVGVVRAGYELQGRVLRPAMVKVAQ